MSDSSKKPLFSDDELEGGVITSDESMALPVDDESPDDTVVPDEMVDTDESSTDEATDLNTEDSPVADESTSSLDEPALQAIADQFSSLDDAAMAAVVRGMPDESRQALCSAVAGTLSDEQLEQCGLAKGQSMAGDGMDDESQLEDDMANARPENNAGSTFMSLTTPPKKAAAAETHPHSLELAQLKADQLLSRARAVHSKNSAVITAEQLEGIEAQLQGQKCLSLLKPDHGTLQPISVLIAMGELMVKGDSNADLLDVKTLNMSLTGDDDGFGAKPVKANNSASNFDEAAAIKAAEDRWKSPNQTTPSFT